MDKQREIFVNEMIRLKKAIDKTESIYLKRDYLKALKKMIKELAEYDNYRKPKVR